MKHLSVQEWNKLENFFNVIESDNDDEIKENFIWGVLDRYPRQLTEEEALTLLTNKHLDSKDQPKFINFFNKILKLNNNQSIFVECSNLLREFNRLPILREKVSNSEFKQLLLLKNSVNARFIKTDNFQILNLFFHLMIREIIYFDFFIPELNSAIIGNCELALPIYSTRLDDIHCLEQIAEHCDLFIRNIE